MTGSQIAVEVATFGPRGFLGSRIFTLPEVSIGRDPAAQIYLNDPSVSLRHALLYRVGDDYCIRDLGSRAGTLVNGEAARERAVAPTDEVAVGVFRLRVTVHKAQAYAEADAAARRDPLLVPTPSVVPLHVGGAAAPLAMEVEEQTVVRLTGASAHAKAAGDEIDMLLGEGSRLDALLLEAGVPPEPWRDANASKAANGAPRLSPSPRIPSPPPMPSAMTVPLAWVPAPLPPPRSSRSPAPAAAPASSRPPSPAAVSAGPASTLLPPPRSPSPHPALPAPPQPPLDLAPPLSPTGAVRADADEDEDDADFVPSFDLFRALLARGLRAGSNEPAVVEVVRFKVDRVISIRHLAAGAKLRLPGSSVVLGQAGKDGRLALDASATKFGVRQDGRPLPSQEAGALVVAGKLPVVPGRQITMGGPGGEALLVHLVARAPALPRSRASFGLSLQQLAGGLGSTLLHIALLAVIGALLVGKERAILDLNQGRFATIAVKEIELEPPPPVPRAADAPRPERHIAAKQVPVPQAPSRAHPGTVAVRTPISAPKRSEPSEEPAPAVATSKILSALDTSTPKAGTTVTNLDAAPRGEGGGGFKISGPIGKAPGDTLQVAGAGAADGQVVTKSASELGKVGRVERQATSGPVRARVSAIPQAIRGEGHLDRGEIQRVVNAHVHQVQGCYERQLMKDPGLSGKITVEWVIDLSGGVAQVRVKQSTIRGVEVATCIQSAIQGWRFPTPQGGTVTVTYPFAFSTLGN